jgi:hypothetical protein
VSGPAENEVLVSLTEPQTIAAAADHAWGRGDDRAAGRLRLALLRSLLDLRDRMTVVADRGDAALSAEVQRMEQAMIEELIGGLPTIWPLQSRVGRLLEAEVDLLVAQRKTEER